jgi:hypothetical protein
MQLQQSDNYRIAEQLGLLLQAAQKPSVMP